MGPCTCWATTTPHPARRPRCSASKTGSWGFPIRPESLTLAAAWAALFLALAFVPDQKILRYKLLALEAGAGAILAWHLLRCAASRKPLWQRTPLDWAVGLYGLSGLVFYALSPEPQNSEAELTRILFSCACFFAAAQTLARPAAPQASLRVWCASAAACGLYAVGQRLGSLGPFLFPQMGRPFGTFGNPIFLGAYLAASLALTLSLLLGASRARERLLLGLCAAAQGAGLWLAQSRAAWAGLLTAAGLWALGRLRGGRRWAALAALAGAAAGLAFHFQDRQWTHGLIWRDTLSLWRDHPWLGCGLGRFHMEFPAYASEALRALWPEHKVIVNFAHNEYLQVLAETGVLGLAVFALIPALALRELFLAGAAPERAQTRAPASPHPPLAEPAALAASALFAANLFSPDLRFGVSSFIAFSALGFAGAAWGQARSWPALSLRPVPAGLGLLLLGLWGRFAARPILAERRLKEAPEFHIQATPEAQAALQDLERRFREDPKNADLAENLAYLYAREKAWEPAIARFELAARLAPERPGPHNNLGNIHYSIGRFDKAIECWEKSLTVKPDQLDAHLNLGKLLYERGRIKESARHLQAALGLSPSNEKARILLKKMVE